MEEIWKDIEGYYGLYQISNKGRVKSFGNDRKRKDKILKPNKNGFGYLKVCLYKKGKRKDMLVHRLVCEAFLDNPNNLPEVNHRNEIKTDNRLENLEYCDRMYNCNFGTRNERISKAFSKENINNPKKSKDVLCIETGIVYKSAKEVQRKLGFAQSNICNCCNGKLKEAYKLHWKYVD